MTRTDLSGPADLDRLFRPRSIAVIGASTKSQNLGTTKLRRLREFGYDGALYAIHPGAAQVEGVPAVPSLRALPEPVDYAFVTLPAPQVPATVREAAGCATFVQVASAGFSESGKAELEQELLEAARFANVRLIGPNCLGMHSPAGRVTFLDQVSREPGNVSIASQSGGLATDMVRNGEARGLAFNEVITLGNSIDIGVVDLVDRFREDPASEYVGLYVESIRDGRRFLSSLSQLAATKPVVLLRGGVTGQGSRSAASHTGGMATPANLWRGICRQLGVIPVDTLDEFLAVLAALSVRNRSQLRRVALVGPGGGASVIATDVADRLGFEVVPFSQTTRAAIADIGVPAGSSVGNPVDLPVGALDALGSDLLADILTHIVSTEAIDLLLLHLNLNNFLSFTEKGARTVEALVDAFLALDDLPVQRALVMRSTGDRGTEVLKAQQRRNARDARQVTFDSIESALQAFSRVATWHETWTSRAACGAVSPLAADTTSGGTV